MISFSRTMLVTGELIQENLLCLRGSWRITSTPWKCRWTSGSRTGSSLPSRGDEALHHPVCPKAVDVLQKAVGMSLREPGWISRVNREIGRQGCQHFAEILVECGRCLDQARMSHDLGETLKAQPSASPWKSPVPG